MATKRLITIQRVDAAGTGYDIYYPKTVGTQVYIDNTETTTVAQHVVDSNLHITAAERTALTGKNGANGFLQLDAQGFVPTANINPALLAITTEFATVAALGAGASTVETGQLVMVTDASADTTVTSGWAIYRKRVDTDPASLDYTKVNGDDAGWQKIAESESIDVVVQWANIQNKPSSTVADIDDAVTKRHVHDNKAVIDKFTESGTTGSEVINYNGNALAYTKDNTTFTLVETSGTVPAASTLKVGDFVFVESGTIAPASP